MSRKESQRLAQASGSRRARKAPQRFKNSTIVITCIVSVVVLAAGVAAIYFTAAPRNTMPIVDQQQTIKIADGPAVNPNAPANEETTDWRIVEGYIKDHPKETREIVKRLRYFLLNHGNGDHVAKANEHLKTYCAAGVKETTTEIREKIARLTKDDLYDDANTALDKWRDEWKEGTDTSTIAAGMKSELTEGRKALAKNLLDQAAQYRKEQKFDEARALYDRLLLRFPLEFKNDAGKGKLDCDAEEKAMKNAAVAEQKNKKAEEEKAARETAAPGVLEHATADFASAMKNFDLTWAKNVLEGATERLAGTSKENEVKGLKTELDKLTALRDRMVKAIKDGKLRETRVKYQGADCQLPDASADGPILQVGAGTVPVRWTQLGPDELSDIAGRSIDANDGDTLFAAGLLRYYAGKYLDAFTLLKEAQKKGVDAAARYAELCQAAMKDASAKEEAAKKQAAAEAQAETDKAMAAAKLQIRHGIWRALPNGVYSMAQDSAAEDPTLMSLQRSVGKGFKSISMDVRGTGEAAGFSFSGKGRRFLLKPKGDWQKISIERDKDGVVMKVDDEIAQSIEKIAFDVTPANLVADGIIYIRFVGTKGEIRNLKVDE